MLYISEINHYLPIDTNQVYSTREGNVFTFVCDSVRGVGGGSQVYDPRGEDQVQAPGSDPWSTGLGTSWTQVVNIVS